LHLQGTCPPFRESLSWIISPFRFRTATIFLHAHLQVVYYKCAKCHKNPISGLGGVALTMDGRTDGWTDGRAGWFLYTPQALFVGVIITALCVGDLLSYLFIKLMQIHFIFSGNVRILSIYSSQSLHNKLVCRLPYIKFLLFVINRKCAVPLLCVYVSTLYNYSPV
jgi:hypothetical protein